MRQGPVPAENHRHPEAARSANPRTLSSFHNGFFADRLAACKSCRLAGNPVRLGCPVCIFSDKIERGPLRRVPGQRNQSLLPPWIVVDLRIQSPSLPDAVDTRSEPQRVARCQPLASPERPKDASPIRARDRLGESPSSRGLAGRVETELFVPLRRSAGRGDGV
jgi:hypothetical protein